MSFICAINVYKCMKKSNINVEGIKKVLPFGAIKEIAKRSNVSRSTVYNVLKRGSRNVEVLKNIKGYIEERNEFDNSLNVLVESQID